MRTPSRRVRQLGADVAPQVVALSVVHRRRRHFFCSAACRRAFQRAPERYAR